MASESHPSNKKTRKIIIVGAGVFGLSTALHLIRRGFTNIHIFERQRFDRNHYDEDAGAHGASCDINKIVRASYGGRRLYQDLAFRAMPEWERWDGEISRCSGEELEGAGLGKGGEGGGGVKLWHDCGFLRLSGHGGLEREEELTQENFPEGLRGTQYRVTDPGRRGDARREGIRGGKMDPFGRLEKGLVVDGVLDMTAGFVLAGRACAWALHLVRKSGGVRTWFGEGCALERVLRDREGEVTGIRTVDGTEHEADLVVLACGGWTPSLVPEVDDLIETTAGSVLEIKIPKERADLRTKFSEENFPVWSWNMGGYDPEEGDSIGGIYGMPITPEGVLKIAFRGAKWTSYTHRRRPDSEEKISYPKIEGLDNRIPFEAMRVLRSFCQENLPELLELDLYRCRLCWYTDSVDNSFLIDRVPGSGGKLVVASGGSGHGFKFLPVLGEHVADVLEGRETEYTRLFQWRDSGRGGHGKRNGLEEGSGGWRTLERLRMVGNREWRGGFDVSRL